jgi:hypothetical protein
MLSGFQLLETYLRRAKSKAQFRIPTLSGICNATWKTRNNL